MPSSVSAHRLSDDERDVGAPHRVVEAAVDVRAERVLAGVTARAVTAVVAERDGLGERHVQPERAGDRRGDLGDLERVGEPGALVVVGEDEDLGLAGQPAERAGVQDAVAVALEAGAPRSGASSTARLPAPGARWRAWRAWSLLALLALRRESTWSASRCRPTSRRGRGARRALGAVAGHGAGPPCGALGHLGVGRPVTCSVAGGRRQHGRWLT